MKSFDWNNDDVEQDQMENVANDEADSDSDTFNNALAQDDDEKKPMYDPRNSTHPRNEIGKLLIDKSLDNEPSVMWSIGYNGYGQHGDGTKNHVEQLTLHQWAKDLDIVKVVHGMNLLFLYIGSASIIIIQDLIHGFAIYDTIRFVGDNFCSYICSDGSLWVSGRNDYGQLGLGHTEDPVTSATKNDFFAKNRLVIRDIISGNGCLHQFAITKDNELYGVGRNTEYQLGFSDQSNRSSFTKLRHFDKNAFKVKQVACSYQYSTFLTSDGGVYVCGRSSDGGLGCGPEVTASETIRKIDELNGKPPMTRIACGRDHTLSLDAKERVWSWGCNNYGQLGYGHTNTTKEPPRIIRYFVSKKIRIIQVACGYDHCLSLGSNHCVYAWGYNSHYACGDGAMSHVHAPKLIEALKYINIVDIQAGRFHNVAMSKDHKFYIWGNGSYFACMTGGRDNVTIPTQLKPPTNQLLSSAVVLSVHASYYATNVIVMRNSRTWARRQIAESTAYVSMVPLTLLQQLLRDEIHDNDRLTEEQTNMILQLSQLQTESDAQKKDIESMSRKMKKLDETIEDQKRDVDKMSNEIEGHQQSLKAQEKQIQSKSREIDGHQKAATAQQQQIQSLQEKLQTQEKQNVSMVQQMNQLNERVQSQEKENTSVTKQLKALQRDIQNRDENIQKLQKQIESQQNTYKVQEKEIQSKTQQIVRLQERLQVKDQEEQAARQTLRTREEENTSMVQQLERLQQEAELRTSDVNRLNAEIAEKDNEATGRGEQRSSE